LIVGESIFYPPTAAFIRTNAPDATLWFQFSDLLLTRSLCDAYMQGKVCDSYLWIISH